MKSYNNTVEENAEKFGYKSANLLELKEVVKEFEEVIKESQKLYGNLKARVPAFMPIDQKLILQHLDQHASDWKKQFKEFQEIYAAQPDKNILSDQSKRALKEVQNTIIDCFTNHLISQELFQKFLNENNIKENDLLMVRSTGVNEDKADMANPGGNESLPCHANMEEISKALGIVAASYIGEKSLSQRLSSGDKSITELPIMPGLVQKMIGEELGGAKQEVYSGVLYTNSGATRIQAAPGHGEYVVNSKGKVDNYYVGQEGIAYSEIVTKDFRLQPQINVEGKIQLVRKENDSKLKYEPSLNEQTVLYLSELSKFIEQKYGTRMDIEFVYDSKNNDLNIVQARAIPKGRRVGLEPSSIAPDFLSKNKSNLNVVDGLAVITPEVNRAAVISKASDVIVTSTIEEALSKYLATKNKEELQAVIVQNPSPDTSHEAGVFNNAGIRVMQVKDTGKFEELLKSEQLVIIDPQHSKIYQLPKHYNSYSDEKLYEENVLNNGIYASALSGRVTAIKHTISREGIRLEPISTDNILEDKTFGRLLQEAKSGDKKSAEELLSLSYKVVNFKDGKQQEKGNIVDKAEKLRANLDSLSAPKIGENNDSLKAALGYNLRLITDANRKKLISEDLYRQTIISGTELSIMLDQMSSLKNLDKQTQNKAYLEYFDVAKKFEGLMVGDGDSLATHLKAKQYDLIAEQLAPDIAQSSKKHLVEALKLRDYLINDNAKQEWGKFCADLCAKPEGAERLSRLVNQVVSLGVHEKWVNFIFLEQNDAKNAETTLQKLEEDFAKIDLKPINAAAQTIKTMESQIPAWREPGKFKGLYKELQQNINSFEQNIKLDDSRIPEQSKLEKLLICEQANSLADVMDKSIKSLTRSPEYGNQKDEKGNDLQAVRFKDMLQEFYKVMSVWVKDHPNMKSENITWRINYINELLYKKDKIWTKKDLELSRNFAVNKIAINAKSAEGGNIVKPSTLEDIFTSIHQNTLVGVSHQISNLIGSFEQQYPKLVNNLIQEFEENVKLPRDGQIFIKNIRDVNSYTSGLYSHLLTISINTPLRGHSCVTDIKYDTKTKDTYVNFSMRGPEENNRWLVNVIDEKIAGIEADLNFTIPPYFNQEKEFTNFEVKLSNDQTTAAKQATEIMKRINESISNSYILAEKPWYHTELYERRIKKLKELSLREKEIGEITPIPIVGMNLSWQNMRSNVLLDKNKQFIKNHISDFMDNIELYTNLTKLGVGYKKIYEMSKKEPKELKILLGYSSIIERLHKDINMDFNEFYKMFKKNSKKVPLIGQQIMFFGLPDVTSEDIVQCTLKQLKGLFDNKITPEEFKKEVASSREAEFFQEYSSEIMELCENTSLSLSELSKIYKEDSEKAEFLADCGYDTKPLQNITSEDIVKCTLEQLEKLYLHKITPEEFKKEVASSNVATTPHDEKHKSLENIVPSNFREKLVQHITSPVKVSPTQSATTVDEIKKNLGKQSKLQDESSIPPKLNKSRQNERAKSQGSYVNK